MLVDDCFSAKVGEWRRGWFALLSSHSPNPPLAASYTQNLSREERLSEISTLLHDPTTGTPKAYTPAAQWAAYPPALIAKMSFFEALFDALPSLPTVQTPLRHIVGAPDDTPLSWLIGLPELHVGHNNKRKSVKWVFPSEYPWGGQAREKKYPALVPSDKNFTHLMLLLAMPTHNSGGAGLTLSKRAGRYDEAALAEFGVAQIPLLLQWMRRLRIVPSRDTVCLALVLWEELNAQAPLVEMLAGVGRAAETGSVMTGSVMKGSVMKG